MHSDIVNKGRITRSPSQLNLWLCRTARARSLLLEIIIDSLLVFGIRLRKVMLFRSILPSDEIEQAKGIGAFVWLEHCSQRRLRRRIDRAWRQTRDDIRRIRIVGIFTTIGRRLFAQFLGRIYTRRVGLQLHLFAQAIEKNSRHYWPLPI